MRINGHPSVTQQLIDRGSISPLLGVPASVFHRTAEHLVSAHQRDVDRDDLDVNPWSNKTVKVLGFQAE